jgi:hypothetical protein
VLLAAAAPATARRDPPPAAAARLGLSVRFGETGGPETLREEIARELAAAIERAGCVARVVPGAPVPAVPGAFSLEVVLHDLEELTEHDMSLYQRHAPEGEAPQQEQAQLARIRARVLLELRALEPARLVASRRLLRENVARPIYDEDAREQARLQFVDDVVRGAASFTCKSVRARPGRAR